MAVILTGLYLDRVIAWVEEGVTAFQQSRVGTFEVGSFDNALLLVPPWAARRVMLPIQ